MSDSKVMLAFLIWFSPLSVSTPLGRVLPVTPVISVLPVSSMWGSADGEQYVILCYLSVQRVFIAHMPFIQKYTWCHRIERNIGTVLPSRSLQHCCMMITVHLMIRCAAEGQNKLGNILATGLALQKDLSLWAVFLRVNSESSHVSLQQQPLNDSHRLLMIFRAVRWSFPEDKNHSLTLASEPFILLSEKHCTQWIQ